MKQFIGSMTCRQVYLDYELDRQIDRIWYKEGEEKCNVYTADEQFAACTAALQQVYVAEQEREVKCKQD